MFTPQSAWEVSLRKQRQLYAKFGKASGIDPGVMWPTREELRAVVEEEREWEPPLQERMAKARADREEKLVAEKKRHDSVVKAMEKMPELIAQYEAKLRKKEADVRKSEERKKRLLEEAKEFFGYDIDYRDPKFKQLQELKEAEAKKLAKQKKKEEKLRRMTASLTSDEPKS
ncbi:large ribosomal subunit protein mL64-like [Lineus longissimus]|uniref:large ribosomal subunit protein mL64-like n=1 Tax=Lineus longissimus TaxID=88925 RepID=UPI00315C90A1